MADEGVVSGLSLPLLPIFVGVPRYVDEFEHGDVMLDGVAVGYVENVKFMLGSGMPEVAFARKVVDVDGDKAPVRFPLFGGPNEGELINPVPDAVLLKPLMMLVEVVSRVVPLLVVVMTTSWVDVGDVKPPVPRVVVLERFVVLVQELMDPVPEAVLLEPLMMLVDVVSRVVPLLMIVAVTIEVDGGDTRPPVPNALLFAPLVTTTISAVNALGIFVIEGEVIPVLLAVV
jgi:hypothetical protein